MMPCVVLIAALLALVLPAIADARRPPTEKERRAIISAVLGDGPRCGPFPAGSCRAVVRVSTARRRWAAVYVRPRAGREGQVQPVTGTAKRRKGRWRRHQLGNGGGCGVPAAVVRDLKLACY